MRSWKTPTPEQVAKTVALLGHVEHYRYFFDRLENPLWLRPLEERGFFATPPLIVRDEAKRSTGFPIWPASRYLERMAALEPTIVCEIALKIDTDNPMVYEDLADAAVQMPADIAARWAKKAAKWVGQQTEINFLLPEKLGHLIGHLARGGEIEAALDLARSLLAVLPDPQEAEKRSKGEPYFLHLEPQTRFKTWDYEQILHKNVPVLVEAAKEKALRLLFNLLGSVIRHSHRNSEDKGPEDYSYIWRLSIESDGYDDLENLLVSAVRNAVEQIAKADPTQVPKLVVELERRPWRVFHRVALHLLRRFPDAAPDLISRMLTERAHLEEFRHEYSLLAKDQFGRLNPEDQEKILKWIGEGLDIEEIKKSWKEWDGREITNEEAERYSKQWQCERLEPLSDSLLPQWKHRYEELIAEVGPPREPERGGVGSGHASPKSLGDLSTMSVQEIAVYLKTWQPPDDHRWRDPSPQGLGQILRQLITSEPERFALEADRFAGCDPTYIRHVIGGFHEAARQNRVFPWPGVLNLCQWVMEQPRDGSEDEAESVDDERDKGWQWTRGNIADLLEEGFKGNAVSIPFELRESVWSVLDPLTNDPDPSQDSDRNGDWLTTSLNAVRGKAMHALVRYALWVRRNIEKGPSGNERVTQGFEEMPEVREVLEAHLNLKKDPTLAIRTVYGQWFPWLVLLDQEWATSYVSTIFPPDEKDQSLWKAAWVTYITRCDPYNNIFEVLRNEYGRAVNRIETSKEEPVNALTNYAERLVGHLMILYWRGKVSLDDSEGLLVRFYEKAFELLRGHAIELMGRALHKDKEDEKDVPAEILDRFKALWEWRVQKAAGSRSREFEGFGWWFVSGKFDNAWAMDQLVVALRLAGKVEPDDMVVERLEALAKDMPQQTIECIRMMVEGDIEGWAVHSWQSHAKTILATAIQSGNPRARQAAIQVVDRLGERGYLNFKDLYPG